MKKFLSIFLIIVLLTLALVSCGAGGDPGTGDHPGNTPKTALECVGILPEGVQTVSVSILVASENGDSLSNQVSLYDFTTKKVNITTTKLAPLTSEELYERTTEEKSFESFTISFPFVLSDFTATTVQNTETTLSAKVTSAVAKAKLNVNTDGDLTISATVANETLVSLQFAYVSTNGNQVTILTQVDPQ